MALLLSVGLVALSVDAGATPSRGPRDRSRGPHAERLPHDSRSVGLPFRGSLRNGVLLRESPFLRYTTEYRAAGNFYGTWELVQLVERTAYRVHQRLPGSRLSVGELSRRNGGRIAGHASHQNGRDVDLSFYMTDARERPFEPFAFARFRGDGVGRPPNQSLRFDDARNWEMVAKLVADGDARVQYIFVSGAIKDRLLREGRRRRAPATVLDRAARLLAPPAEGHVHDNHFHVRIYCAPANRPACRDQGPHHPWAP